MNTYTTQTTTYIWRTLLFNGLALALCQTVFLLVIQSPLIWFFPLLGPIGPLLIALVAFTFTTKRLPLPPRYALTLLPVVLYLSGISAVLFVWWLQGADPSPHPLLLDPVIVSTKYGPYGIPAGLLWVGCLLRTWKYARAAHRTPITVED